MSIACMSHIHFLKDALYLRPETEAVQKLLEGFPREIIWLESFGLEENREDCAEETKKEACWLPTDFDPANAQRCRSSLLPPAALGGRARSVRPSEQQEAPERNIADGQFDSVACLIPQKVSLVTLR